MQITELKLGQSVENQRYHKIDQAQIQAFADATGDHQWIHLDEQRCTKESPFKTTIAHGFLSVSLMPQMFAQCISINPRTTTMINYGMDKLRFLEPVRVNDEIKYMFTLMNKEAKGKGELYKFEGKVLIKDRETPALIGTFLTMILS